MTMMLNAVEARSLARAIEAMRPDWNYAGILHALGTARTRAEKWTVAQAALSAASDPANRTPAVIAMDGRHWPIVQAPHIPGRIEKQQLTEDERVAAHLAYVAACQAKANAPKPPPPRPPYVRQLTKGPVE